MLPTLVDIAEHHLRGTKFNIHVDPDDGLLVQGQEGYQLTWMDAKMGDWVVTPRRGKAVEINALWYQRAQAARRLAARSRGERRAANATRSMRSARANHSIERFWFEEGGYLYDVVDCNGEKGTTTGPAGRTKSSRSRSIIPFWMQERWQSVMRCCAARNC